MNEEQEERLTRQARDTRGQLIVTHDGKDVYALELPEGTYHQSGPYTMSREDS